jgi:quercetin dioxygenase-like cupin family protein
MKIRVLEHAAFSPDRMAKIALGRTPRVQLDLYCLAPGQGQKPHAHADQDKVYYVLKGAGRFRLAEAEETLREGEALVAQAGVEHGVQNDGPEPLLLLVLVAPPPTH